MVRSFEKEKSFFIQINFRSKKFHHFVELCLIKDYLIRSNCEQLLKHPFIRDCQEKQMKFQIKEYLDKTRKYRRSSNHSQQPFPNHDFQKQLQQQLSDEDDDDDDLLIHHSHQQQHQTQRENQFSTLRQNFKSVQTNSINSSSLLLLLLLSFIHLDEDPSSTNQEEEEEEEVVHRFPLSNVAGVPIFLPTKSDVCFFFFFFFDEFVLFKGFTWCCREIK